MSQTPGKTYFPANASIAFIGRKIDLSRFLTDSNGIATLSGKAGKVTFSATEAVKELGIQVRRVGISMDVNEHGELD